jgi:hypothetical protein
MSVAEFLEYLVGHPPTHALGLQLAEVHNERRTHRVASCAR